MLVGTGYYLMQKQVALVQRLAAQSINKRKGQILRFHFCSEKYFTMSGFRENEIVKRLTSCQVSH